jgi:toxin FitB
MSFLLDTNIISELRLGAKADANVLAWRASYAPEDLFLSVVTTGEIRKGVEESRRKDPRKAAIYERWLGFLELEFENRILPVTPEIADLWGRVVARSRVLPLDGFIAATAAHYGYTVVTRNERDFQKTGVDFINPFRP